MAYDIAYQGDDHSQLTLYLAAIAPHGWNVELTVGGAFTETLEKVELNVTGVDQAAHTVTGKVLDDETGDPTEEVRTIDITQITGVEVY